jgi:hypothetical protein
MAYRETDGLVSEQSLIVIQVICIVKLHLVSQVVALTELQLSLIKR